METRVGLGTRIVPLPFPSTDLHDARFAEALRRLIVPGRLINTDTGTYLILGILGQGGTAIAVLVMPVNQARFLGRQIPAYQLEHFAIYPFVENNPSALEYWARGHIGLRVLKIALVRPRDRFYAEVRQSLQHEFESSEALERPAMPTIHNVGEAPLLHLVMEYIRGDTLEALLGRYRQSGHFLPWDQILLLMVKIIEGLVSVHDHSIVHCDLKPENLILRPGRLRPIAEDTEIRILDFGCARYRPPCSLIEAIRADGLEVPLSKTLVQFGFTPAYAAPEQLEGKDISKATDCYALGLILYRLLTGRHPFWARSWDELHTPQGVLRLHSAMQNRPPPPQHPEFDPGRRSTTVLNRLLARTLAYAPASRLDSLLVFRDLLLDVAEERQKEVSGAGQLERERMQRITVMRIQAASARRRTTWTVIKWILIVIAMLILLGLGARFGPKLLEALPRLKEQIILKIKGQGAEPAPSRPDQ